MRRCMHCHTGDIRRVIRSARTCDNITGCCPITIQHMAGSYRPRTAFIHLMSVVCRKRPAVALCGYASGLPDDGLTPVDCPMHRMGMLAVSLTG
jgi:hypothetical protein